MSVIVEPEAPHRSSAHGRGAIVSRIDRRPFVLLGAAALLGVAIVAGVSLGAVRVPVSDVIGAILGDHAEGNRSIVWNFRLPRVVLAALVGINLGLAGALLQSLTRNPLAEPNLLGISAGGGLAAVLALKLDPATPFTELRWFAFLGALAGAALVYGLAWRGGVVPLRLLLAGVAVGALFTALTTGILLTSSLTLQSTMAWLAGGLAARSWEHLRAILPFSGAGVVASMLLCRKLDVLALGDEPATGLGLPVQWLRVGLTVVVAVLTGSAVAVSGLIGFVGLIVPHMARALVGPRHSYLLPVSALLGGSLLVSADIVARTIASPRELPIGIVTAVAGAPFFLYLLRRAV
ncbi:MAG: iron ABC transporter permease [Chloroflexi bacterium]|nr:iron ABC transporter permease [Chloroflexota bacterium]